MSTTIVGGGPTGMFLAIALARRGRPVTVVDRDPGPVHGGGWARRGVMQFHHPHGFRAQVVDALQAEMPDVWVRMLEAGAVPATAPDDPTRIAGIRLRRAVFERVLREAAAVEPGLRVVVGNAERVHTTGQAVRGVRVDGRMLASNLVIDATGRNGRLTDGFRAAAAGGDTGISYVSRQYKLLPGAEPGQSNSPMGAMSLHHGYQAMVFTQDQGTFSTLLVRSADDAELGLLRDEAAFNAAAAAIPILADWTSASRSRPITSVLPGGRLFNSYRGQLDADGRVAASGLFFIGDAVSTTTPTAGRGVALAMQQARQLLHLLDHESDPVAVAHMFDAWCLDHIKPWFDDHVHADTDQIRRWSGGDADLTAKLPSDLIILAAMQADRTLMRFVGPYLAMQASPTILDAAQPRARELYASGWRPTEPPGPTRDNLAELVTAATAAEPAMAMTGCA